VFYVQCYNKGTRMTKEENRSRCHNNWETVTYQHSEKFHKNWMVKFLSLKMKALRPSKRPLTIYRSTRSNIPVDPNLLQHRCASLKFRKIILVKIWARLSLKIDEMKPPGLYNSAVSLQLPNISYAKCTAKWTYSVDFEPSVLSQFHSKSTKQISTWSDNGLVF